MAFAGAVNQTFIGRLNKVIENVKTAAVDYIVPDSVITEVLKEFDDPDRVPFLDSKDVSYRARHAMLRHWLGAAFENEAAYTDAVWGSTDDPHSSSKAFWDARDRFMENLRVRLETPDNVRLVYAAKRPALENGLKRMTPQGRASLAALLKDAKKGALMAPELRDLLRDVHAAEDRYSKAERGTDELYAAYEARRQLDERLRAATPDVFTTQFVERRRAEGDDALVAAYISIMDDVLTLVHAIH